MTSIDAKIRAVNNFIDTEVMKRRRMNAGNWSAVAVKKTQGTAEGIYAWMNDIPLITRKQASGYTKASLSSQALKIISEEVGLFIEIKKQDIRDDKYGVFSDLAGDLARRMDEFPQDGVFGLLMEGDQTTYNGKSILAYDGLSFFNDAHYVNGRDTTGGTYDNKLATGALSPTTFATAEAALAVLPDNRGKALKQAATALIVPPQLAQTGAEILYARTVATGGENMASNENRARSRGLPPIELVVVPELANDAAVFYLASNSTGRAGIIWQETEALHLVPLIDPTMKHVIEDNLYVWAAVGESAFGFGDPRTIVRCNG